MQESARGVLLTLSGLVLLMKVSTPTGHLWITPGGRIRPGEDPAVAAIREVGEETGCHNLTVGAEVWIRHGTYFAGGKPLFERERFFMMPTEPFEPSASGMEPQESNRHQGFRWWAIEEIASSPEAFVPRRLAELLKNLDQFGPPPSPLDSGE